MRGIGTDVAYLARALKAPWKAPQIREASVRLAAQACDADWTHEECLAAALGVVVASREASGAVIRIRGGSVVIEPGAPWQNAFVESFSGKLRDERPVIELFHTLLGAKVMAEDYRQHSNTYQPHSSLGYRTPNEFTLDRNNSTGLEKTLARQAGARQYH